MNITNNFKKFILFFIMSTQFVFSAENDILYDEFTFLNKLESGEVNIFKVQCHNLKKKVCSLNSLSIITKTENQPKCLIISKVIFNKANATMHKDGSWQVSRFAGNCDVNESYVFSKAGMILTSISNKEFTKNQIEKYECKIQSSQLVKANYVDGFGVNGINLGSCKEIDTLMLMGDLD